MPASSKSIASALACLQLEQSTGIRLYSSSCKFESPVLATDHNNVTSFWPKELGYRARGVAGFAVARQL